MELEVIGDPGAVTAALDAAGAVVVPDGKGLLDQRSDGDPFALVRDALAESGTGIRRLGPRRITLEDIYLAGGKDA